VPLLMTLKYIWRSFSLGCYFLVHFSHPWHAFASHGLPAIAELLVFLVGVKKLLIHYSWGLNFNLRFFFACCQDRQGFPVLPTVYHAPLIMTMGSESWVMWVIGQLCDGSYGSWVTKDDPFPSLVGLLIIFCRNKLRWLLESTYSWLYNWLGR